jgi:DNA-binding NarL/FixJ family response regulator
MSASGSVMRAKVVILEDEPGVAARLKSKLHELGNIEPSVVSDMQTFANVVKGEQFDAASIDWEVHDVAKGPEAIQLLNAAQPDAATVVNTKHEVENAARHCKVDAFVRKEVNLESFGQVIEKAARLGLARQIAKSLRTFDMIDLPDLSPGRTEMITEDAENIIHEKSRTTAIKAKLSDRPDDRVEVLTELLQRRGWWEIFDVVEYTAMSKIEKLKTLVACAGISPDDLAAILEEALSKERILERNRDRSDFCALMDREDDLLSILAFVLRLSDYDPQIVPLVWREKRVYKKCGSLDRPPWDEMGLADYLKENGQSGIIESLTWIRSY